MSSKKSGDLGMTFQTLFIFQLTWNCWTMLTLVLPLCWFNSIWDGEWIKPAHFSPIFPFYPKTPPLGLVMIHNTWYQRSYAISSEMLISLSAHSLECTFFMNILDFYSASFFLKFWRCIIFLLIICFLYIVYTTFNAAKSLYSLETSKQIRGATKLL